VETDVVRASRRGGCALGDPRRCTATSKQSGTRCKRFRTPGRQVCRFHGGKSLRGFSHPGLTHGRRSIDTMVRIVLRPTLSGREYSLSVTPWTKGHPMEEDPQ
jgi:hypothetical protein